VIGLELERLFEAAHTYTCMCTYIYAETHAYIGAYTHMHTCIYIRTQIHTHTHTYTIKDILGFGNFLQTVIKWVIDILGGGREGWGGHCL
jgi:hypothetical protein